MDDPWWDRNFGWLMLVWLLIWLAVMVALGVVAAHFIAKWW
jgi:hypothetical protein